MSLQIQKENQDHTAAHRNGYHDSKSPSSEHYPNGQSESINPFAPFDGKAVSEAEYWSLYYEAGQVEGDTSYEWNNGILEAKPMASKRQARLYNWFIELVFHFLRVHPIAQVMNLEIGFRIAVDDPKHPDKTKKAVRKPDIGIIHEDNSTPWLDDERSFKGICDMVIESLSDSDQGEIDRDTITKKAEYEAAGIREYFILDPDKVNQHFYRLDENGRYVEIAPENGLIRSEVLSGFQFRLSDFDDQPELEEMAEDEVYAGFMLPAYQAALKVAKAERLRADQAIARADRVDEINQRVLAKLAEAGIDISDIDLSDLG